MGPIGFPVDLLAGWYNARAMTAAARAPLPAGAAAQASASKGPNDYGVIPPWDVRAQPAGLDELARDALGRGVFFREDEFSDMKASADTRALFSLHQGLKRLYALAAEAADKSANDIRRGFLERRFQEGLAQFETAMAALDLKNASLVRGETRNVAESAVKLSRGSSEYVTGAIHDGAFDAEVAAFQGDVAFTISVRQHNQPAVDIQIDLSEMGAAPRTLDAVASFINGKLEAEGMLTRFSRARIGEPNASGVFPDSRFGFKISGVSIEKVTFSAEGAPSLYLAGISGTGDAAAGQLTRLNGLDGSPEAAFIRRIEADPVITINDKGEDVSTPGVLRAHSTATGPNGELYVLAEVESPVGGVALKGQNDLVLLKYDSTGRQIWSRVLGAADSAHPGALAVDSDGSVVITGRVNGALGSTIDTGGADGFVARYSATGSELWLQRFGTAADDVPSALALGPNGQIYVGGQTGGGLGGAMLGGRDGFVRAYGADGAVQWTRQIGGEGADGVTALAVAADGALLVGSVQDGAGKLTRYDPADGDAPPLWTYDLGDMGHGSLNAIAVDGDSIYLTGSAGAGSAMAGAHAGHAGGRDAFLMRLDGAGGAPSMAYNVFLGSETEDSARDIVVHDGAVYIAGRTNGELPGAGAASGSRSSFVARLDAETGALAWTHTVSGRGGVSEGVSLAIDPGGDSVLDRLGLPRGTLDYGGGQMLTERTALRPGDHFYVSVDGGRKRKITVEANETYLSLTFKINAVLLLKGRSEVGRSAQGSSLRIRPAGDAVVELFAGDKGRDALVALGLEPGGVQRRPNPSDKNGSGGTASAAPPLYALGVPAALSVGALGSATQAAEALDKAMETIRRAWRELNTNPALDGMGGPRPAGHVPAHLQAQLANFQAGLARLSAGPDIGLLI